MRNIRHSKETTRWGTEPAFIEMARAALGGTIELDPMSSAEFNESVRAERYFSEESDCFQHQWRAQTVLLNPPGGKIVKAWNKLVTEYCFMRVNRAVWIGFSVEQLNLLASEIWHPLDFSWFLPRKRISFVRHDGFIGAPGHSNYVVGLGMPHELFTSSFNVPGKFGCGPKAIPD